jgi:hypothetical protein
MCLGIQISKAKAFLGSEGTEKLWPTLEEPYCFRGFNYPEVMMLAYLYGFAPMYHEFVGGYSPAPSIPDKIMSLPEAYRDLILKNSIGVLSLQQGSAYHAVAICDGVVYDPRGNYFILPVPQYKHVHSCITFEPRQPKFVTKEDLAVRTALALR